MPFENGLPPFFRFAMDFSNHLLHHLQKFLGVIRTLLGMQKRWRRRIPPELLNEALQFVPYSRCGRIWRKSSNRLLTLLALKHFCKLNTAYERELNQLKEQVNKLTNENTALKEQLNKSTNEMTALKEQFNKSTNEMMERIVNLEKELMEVRHIKTPVEFHGQAAPGDQAHSAPSGQELEQVVARCAEQAEIRSTITLDCEHQHIGKCSAKCPPCFVPIEKHLICGHFATIPCSQSVSTYRCVEEVEKEWPICHHKVKVKCHQRPELEPCPMPCGAMVPTEEGGCGHMCKGTCGQCRNGRLHIECIENCSRTLICGHQCDSKCSRTCPPCQKPCETACGHSQCGMIAIEGEQQKKLRKQAPKGKESEMREDGQNTNKKSKGKKNNSKKTKKNSGAMISGGNRFNVLSNQSMDTPEV